MGLYLGLISGTSMDAIDAALVDFDTAPLRSWEACTVMHDKPRFMKLSHIGRHT